VGFPAATRIKDPKEMNSMTIPLYIYEIYSKLSIQIPKAKHTKKPINLSLYVSEGKQPSDSSV